MSYLIQRENNGVKEYYTGENWTRDRLQAKEYRLKIWQMVLNVLLKLIEIFGTNIKIIKK